MILGIHGKMGSGKSLCSKMITSILEDNNINSEIKSFKKRSLLDIALNPSKDGSSEDTIENNIDQVQEDLHNENTSPEISETPEIIDEGDSQNNFDEENKKQLTVYL